MQGDSETDSPWLGYLGSRSLAVYLSFQELCQLQDWLLVPSKEEKLAPPLAPVQPSALLSQQKDLCFLPLLSPRAEMSLSHLPCGHRKWYYIRNNFATLFLLIIATPTVITDRCNTHDSCFYYFLLQFACVFHLITVYEFHLSFFPFLHLKLNLISVIYR